MIDKIANHDKLSLTTPRSQTDGQMNTNCIENI